jgi:alpha-ketoglutarate-dependent 2,4-dichlorophenoxyacetate dioxygenase
MALTATQLHPFFAAELSGIDMGRPPAGATRDALVAAMDRYAVCVIRNARAPSDEEHIAFSRSLGPMQRTQALKIEGRERSRIAHPEIIDQSNLDADGAVFREGDRQLLFKRANRLWHTDLSFHPCERHIRCSPRTRCRRAAGPTPSSPTCAPLTMRCRKR